jgi:hypothetical protein
MSIILKAAIPPATTRIPVTGEKKSPVIKQRITIKAATGSRIIIIY